MRQQKARQIAVLEAENQTLRALLEIRRSSGLARLSPSYSAMRVKLIQEAGAQVGIGRACAAVGLSRAHFYREQQNLSASRVDATSVSDAKTECERVG